MLSILSVPYHALYVPQTLEHMASRKLEQNVQNILFLFTYKPREKKLITNAYHVKE